MKMDLVRCRPMDVGFDLRQPAKDRSTALPNRFRKRGGVENRLDFPQAAMAAGGVAVALRPTADPMEQAMQAGADAVRMRMDVAAGRSR